MLLAAGLVLGASLQWALAAGAEPAGKVFEIRTYHTFPGRLDALHKRFREHTMKIFEKHGMTNVGVLGAAGQSRPRHDTDLCDFARQPGSGQSQLGGVHRRPGMEEGLRGIRRMDGKIVERIESVFMDATDYSPLR